MRDIKFRSAHYNLKTNEFSHFSYWGVIDHKGDFSNDCFSSPSSASSCYRKFEEQYTGLKDRNGVEIFEGDIVKRIETTNIKEFNGVVRWGYLEFTTNVDYDDISNSVLDYQTEIIEVIGNIHEKN